MRMCVVCFYSTYYIGRVDSYVEVELDVDDVEEVDDERDIYKYPGDLFLDEALGFTFGDVVKK